MLYVIDPYQNNGNILLLILCMKQAEKPLGEQL
jgi:hypothetical protein